MSGGVGTGWWADWRWEDERYWGVSKAWVEVGVDTVWMRSRVRGQVGGGRRCDIDIEPEGEAMTMGLVTVDIGGGVEGDDSRDLSPKGDEVAFGEANR